VKDEQGKRTKQLAFPDDAMTRLDFGGGSLMRHLGGLFVAGGGDITREQAEVYQLLANGRPGDCFVPAETMEHVPSKLNSLYSASDAKFPDVVISRAMALVGALPAENVVELVAAEETHAA
jgi:hypothetical protein